MPESTISHYLWDTVISPLFVFLLALVGYNVKKAHDKIDSMPKDYVQKVDYAETLKLLRDDIRDFKQDNGNEIRGLKQDLKDGLGRIHSRVDHIAEKEK